MCTGKLAVYWPPALVFTFISYIYVVFMAYNVIPQWERATSNTPSSSDPNEPNNYTPSVAEIYSLIVGFHVLFFMLIWSFYKASTTCPGAIPTTDLWKHGTFNIPQKRESRLLQIISDPTTYNDEMLQGEREFLKSMIVVERKLKKGTKQGQLRFCSTCDMYKPDRTHHCRICNQCILRMDHHCPWIANCVGFHNYKHFFLLLFYAALCLTFVLVGMARRFVRSFRPVLTTETFLKTDLPVLVAYILCTFLFTALVLFFFFQFSLAVNSLTTIELREKKNNDDPTVKHRWAVSHVKFDQGSRYSNFTHIMGSPWMWLVPVESDCANTDGTYSEVTTFKEIV